MNVEALSTDGPATKEETVVEEKKYAVLDTAAIPQRFNRITMESNLEKEEKAVAAKLTTYGTDCIGCYNKNGFGGTASGVKLSFDAVRQSDGTWKDGITYDGYYIVATNTTIPIGSIIEVSNHGFNGKGLSEGGTFYAMVLDRGAMTLNHLDLFVGSENASGITLNAAYQPTMKIIRYGF